jgi:uncharacterized protein DUF6285
VSLYGRPTAQELAAAVEDFLRGEVLPTLDGRLAFQTLVAANALAIVGRELAAGSAAESAHAERLAEFGASDDAELAAAIRRGDLDDRAADLVAALRASVEAKVAVTNPKYLHPSES